ncbi:Alpha-D-phosphohexomutase superfamily [Penicillium occitanis (nom. inval.)]|nr:Alpha-D-phosphohexomutase superfamily [Penicillium occitanis (nom. inval.)]PCG96353.1 hypothetical protein PENOC_073300 [Penicillium occitanis (nom. inval.)]
MRAGFAFMNSLTVIQASQGLAKFLKATNEKRAIQNGIVIGADARHNSHRFAVLVANAMLALGFKVQWLGSVIHTPLVAWATGHTGAAAGVMITASHNPAKDNGYKVYLQGGVQVNAPWDAEISQHIKENLVPWKGAWRTGTESEFSRSIYIDNVSKWVDAVVNYAKSTVPEILLPTQFCYTPLHGVGGNFLPHLLHQIGIGTRMISVDKQFEPDPNFPTVPFPNPEEDHALDLAIMAAEANFRDLLIANDPDADRFAAAQIIPERGSWYTFTGNQIGVLLAAHIIENLKFPCPKRGYYMLNTTVSTTMLSKMCAAHGIQYRETLTGFKWMGSIARDLEEKEGYIVPFAFEEAIGYMFPGTKCYDKDGLTAAAVFLLAEAHWRKQGLTPFDKLHDLFKKYGHHETFNNYFRSPNPQTTADLFSKIRAGNNKWKKGAKFGHKTKFTITRWRDMTLGYDSDTPDNMPELPVDKGSHMLTLWLDDDIKFTLRGSGTEPKVKFYIESWSDDQDKAVGRVCDVFDAVLSEWIKPLAPSMTWAEELFTSSSHLYGRSLTD